MLKVLFTEFTKILPTVEYVPVVQIGNITQTIEELKKLGFLIAGADMNGEDYSKVI